MNLTDNPMTALIIVSVILLFIGLFMDITPAIRDHDPGTASVYHGSWD